MDGLTEGRVEALLRAAGDVRCVVVGDLMLDRYVTGTVGRISPEAPVPVVRVEAETSAVGGAANVAHNVIALGGSCAVVGVAGHDPGGVLLKRELGALGIVTRGLLQADRRPTTVKTRVLARHHQVVRFDNEVDGDVPPEIAEGARRGGVEARCRRGRAGVGGLQQRGPRPGSCERGTSGRSRARAPHRGGTRNVSASSGFRAPPFSSRTRRSWRTPSGSRSGPRTPTGWRASGNASAVPTCS